MGKLLRQYGTSPTQPHHADGQLLQDTLDVDPERPNLAVETRFGRLAKVFWRQIVHNLSTDRNHADQSTSSKLTCAHLFAAHQNGERRGAFQSLTHEVGKS